MKDEDYIRKAVELADGWKMGSPHRKDEVIHDETGLLYLDEIVVLDALAAQLVRQVDATKSMHHVRTYPTMSQVLDTWERVVTKHRSKDRTMNTIKAIVDSKVLESDR